MTPSSPIALSVIIPVLNEVGNLRDLCKQLKDVLGPMNFSYEVIFVDDGSTDGSVPLLESLAAEDPNIKAILFRKHFGQTTALRAGMDAASGEFFVTMDADLQNDPADIPMLLSTLEQGYDVVYGWRKERHDSLVSRRIPSRVANWLIGKVTGFPVHDLGCAIKAMRSSIVRDLQMVEGMHRFIPILAFWQGARCTEVVVHHHSRKAGTSKYGIDRTVPVILDLITIKLLNKYFGNPMKLVGGLGLLCFVLSFASGIATLWMKIFLDEHFIRNPLTLATLFLLVIGIQFLMMGMLGEICARIYFSANSQSLYAVRKRLNFAENEA